MTHSGAQDSTALGRAGGARTSRAGGGSYVSLVSPGSQSVGRIHAEQVKARAQRGGAGGGQPEAGDDLRAARRASPGPTAPRSTSLGPTTSPCASPGPTAPPNARPHCRALLVAVEVRGGQPLKVGREGVRPASPRR